MISRRGSSYSSAHSLIGDSGVSYRIIYNSLLIQLPWYHFQHLNYKSFLHESNRQEQDKKVYTFLQPRLNSVINFIMAIFHLFSLFLNLTHKSKNHTSKPHVRSCTLLRIRWPFIFPDITKNLFCLWKALKQQISTYYNE